ncbi:MAG: efflux RND transporter periplasmic adaptor subunit [Ferruginibacter sp.]
MIRTALRISICGLLVTGCSQKEHKEEEAAGKYAATSPLIRDTSFTREYVAQLQSIKNIEIRAQEKGYLESIFTDEGRFVHAGQLLFRIMPKMYEAEKLKAAAAVKEAELELLNAKTLADKNIISKSEQALKQAKLDEAKAELALAEFHLSQTEIKAPYDGILDRIPLKLGSLIDEGALLTTLSDNKNIYAYFNVSESEYLNYKSAAGNASQNIVSLLLANNQPHKYKGEIETVEGQFDNETGNIAFRAKFPNPEMLIKHGETGKVLMTVPVKNALLIPQKATYEIQDKLFVFVIDKNNAVQSRQISISGTLPDLFVVQSGLAAEDKILLEGVQKVKDGDKISADFQKPEDVLAHLKLKAE